MSLNKCSNCRYFNDFAHTYVKDDCCCSYWHTGYHHFERAGERLGKNCFVPRKQIVQLSFDFVY